MGEVEESTKVRRVFYDLGLQAVSVSGANPLQRLWERAPLASRGGQRGKKG